MTVSTRPSPDRLREPTRREFLTASSLALLGAAAQDPAGPAGPTPEPIIDIHQHLNYSGRPDAVLLAHQRAMGITTTVLLPAGRPVIRPSTNQGQSNALEADALGNDACWRFAREHAAAYRFAANEVPDLDGAKAEIERYLRRGAVMIAEESTAFPGVTAQLEHDENRRLLEKAEEARRRLEKAEAERRRLRSKGA